MIFKRYDLLYLKILLKWKYRERKKKHFLQYNFWIDSKDNFIPCIWLFSRVEGFDFCLQKSIRLFLYYIWLLIFEF